MSERLWYYVQGEAQQGPVPESQVRSLLAAGKLAADALVWSEGMAEWTHANKTEALRSQAAAPAPQPVGGRAWYFMQGNNPNPTGPVPEAEFHRLTTGGQIGPQTLVWTEGMAQWVPAGQVPGLGPNGGGPAAQAAPAVQAGPTTLTPSDIVFLNGEQFAVEQGMLAGGNFTLLHNGTKVGHVSLATAMFAAALLANEAAGTLRLSVKPKKAMLGLKTTTAAWAEPTGAKGNWPAQSFEEVLLLHMGGQARWVTDILFDALLVMSTYPHTLPTLVLQTFLTDRGILTTTEKKKLGIFNATSFNLPPQSREVIAAHSTAPVKKMIAELQRSRPDLYQAIEAAVKDAIGRRREYDND
jgi:hypothetical protein